MEEKKTTKTTYTNIPLGCFCFPNNLDGVSLSLPTQPDLEQEYRMSTLICNKPFHHKLKVSTEPSACRTSCK